MSKLEPISPEEAVEMYLQSRSDISANTRSTHEKRLRVFENWCADQDIGNLNELSGRDIHRYKIDEFSKKENGEPYSEQTVRGYLDTLRVFLRFVVSIDGVEEGLSEKVNSPRPNKSRDEELTKERADIIRENICKYEYASLRHVVIQLTWRIGCRVGTLVSIDIDDVDFENNRIKITHQPRSGTPLKNKWNAEREVAIKDDTATILRDYIDTKRIDVTDSELRKPLLTSSQGRRSISSIREIIYSVTRPCEWSGDCPHDKDPDVCEAAQRREYASRCPSSVSPHPVRRGAISAMLRNDIPKPVVQDRCDVSSEVLDEYYSTLTAAEKAETRRNYLSDWD